MFITPVAIMEGLDHPVTKIEQYVQFLKQTMHYCEEKAKNSKEAPFYWTVEGIWTYQLEE